MIIMYILYMQIAENTIQESNIKYIEYCTWQSFLKTDTNIRIDINYLDCSKCMYSGVIYEIIYKIQKSTNLFINILDLSSPCFTIFQYDYLKKHTYNFTNKPMSYPQIYYKRHNQINTIIYSCKELYKSIENTNKLETYDDEQIYMNWEHIFISNPENISNISKIQHINLAFCSIEEIITNIISKLKHFRNLKSIDFYESNLNEKHIELLKLDGIYDKLTCIETTKSALVIPLYQTINISEYIEYRYLHGGSINLIININIFKHDVFKSLSSICANIYTIKNLYLMNSYNTNSQIDLCKLTSELSKIPRIENIHIIDNSLSSLANQIKRENTIVHANSYTKNNNK